MARIGSLNILSDAVPVSQLGLETEHGVAIGQGPDNPLNWTVPGTTGQVLAGISGNDPAFFTLIGGGGISVNTNTMTETITISGSTSGFSWNVISTSTTMFPNNGYIVVGGGTVNLMISPAGTTGEGIQVVGYGAMWNIQLASQFVNLVTAQATTSLTSTSNFDTLTLLCVDSSHYIITTTQGNITIV